MIITSSESNKKIYDKDDDNNYGDGGRIMNTNTNTTRKTMTRRR